MANLNKRILAYNSYSHPFHILDASPHPFNLGMTLGLSLYSAVLLFNDKLTVGGYFLLWFFLINFVITVINWFYDIVIPNQASGRKGVSFSEIFTQRSVIISRIFKMFLTHVTLFSASSSSLYDLLLRYTRLAFFTIFNKFNSYNYLFCNAVVTQNSFTNFIYQIKSENKLSLVGHQLFNQAGPEMNANKNSKLPYNPPDPGTPPNRKWKGTGLFGMGFISGAVIATVYMMVYLDILQKPPLVEWYVWSDMLLLMVMLRDQRVAFKNIQKSIHQQSLPGRPPQLKVPAMTNREIVLAGLSTHNITFTILSLSGFLGPITSWCPATYARIIISCFLLIISILIILRIPARLLILIYNKSGQNRTINVLLVMASIVGITILCVLLAHFWLLPYLASLNGCSTPFCLKATKFIQLLYGGFGR